MMRRDVRLAVLAIALAAACDAPVAPTGVARASPRQDLAAARFAGRALDYGTSTGVPNLTVALGTVLFPSFVADSQTTTDAGGSFSVTVPPGAYFAAVNGVFSGSINVTSGGARGDLLARWGTCVARYGVVADAETRQPLAGVRVQLVGQTATTDADGWYRIDLGCPANGLVGFNTTFISFSHPDYPNTCQVAGRGVFGVARLDLFLGRRTIASPCSFL